MENARQRIKRGGAKRPRPGGPAPPMSAGGYGVLSRRAATVNVPAVVLPSEELVDPSLRPVVLLVDDNTDYRSLIIDYLTGIHEYEVLAAASGEEALRLLPSCQPQVVLLDLAMPGIGGMETLQQITTLRPGLCVIMVTGTEDLSIARRALLVGAADYLVKPFDLDYLGSVLKTYMAQLEQADTSLHAPAESLLR
jgi:DNA-binding NtrC family response regulator